MALRAQEGRRAGLPSDAPGLDCVGELAVRAPGASERRIKLGTRKRDIDFDP